VEGTARDVDAYGRLLLDVDGTVQTLGAGDVVHLR
jgi:BirA family transcriptional regulator, biotin operon repressor / biotin---[acetyl-CoA-carboxylase] ligase